MAGPAKRSWRTWLLVASLGLNLAFLGMIGGAMLKGPPPQPLPGIGHYARALPEPYRRQIGHALRESRRDWGGTREAMRAQRDALAAALTAEPFNPAGVAEVLKEESRLNDALAARGTGLLIGQLERMSAEERAAYAEDLRAARGRRSDRRR